MNFYPYSFTSHIERHSLGFNKRGELFYTVLFLPDELSKQLPLSQYPRLRVEGEMHEMPFEGALQPAKGRWYFLLSKNFMQTHQLQVGDVVEVRFEIGNQDRVDLPTELQQALANNARAADIWETFSPGKKRGFVYQIASAKQAATRERRAQKMIQYILEGKNAGGR